MKILITAPSLDENANVSGISTLVRQIIKYGSEEFVHFQAGRADNEKSRIRWIFNQISLVPRFYERIRREDIDLVHINTAFNPLSIVRDFALVKTARFAGKKIVIHLHGGEFLAREFTNANLKKIAEKMLRFSDVTIVLSELEQQIIEQRWQDLKIRVLENAIALDEIETRKKSMAVEKTIVFLGRLHESKGLHEIIETCRILRAENFDFRFRCFGAGALENFFVAEMTKILGDKFYFGGVASGKEKWKELAASDVFLLPSRYGEGLPIAMLEALAAGCIVVAADVASVRAVVRDGANGFLVEPYNTAQIVSKLKTLLSGEIDLTSLRQNARTTIEEKYSFGDYIKKLESLYAETVSLR